MNTLAVMLLAIAPAAAEADDTRPPLSDARRFGYSKHEAIQYRNCWLQRAAEYDRGASIWCHHARRLNELARGARWAAVVWDVLDDCLCHGHETGQWRRDHLVRLRDILGPAAYYAGEMPFPD